MIKKIIFFTLWPLNLRDYQRFGIDVLTKNGFEVLLFDFSPFLSPGIENKIVIPDLMDYKGNHRFYSQLDAIHAITKLDKKECFVILIRPYDYRSFKIYRALSKAKVPYAIPFTSAVPQASVGRAKKQGLFKRASKISVSKFKEFFTCRLFKPAFSKYLGIRQPTFWLVSGTYPLNGYSNIYPFGKNTEILQLHALDYNIYLENKGAQSINVCDKAVFLDPGAPQSEGDNLVIGSEMLLTKEKYYPSLCKFFNRVEHEQGVKIEVAAHPRSNHQPHPGYFGGRLTVRGKTFQMIQQSKFVITHGSTAVNFAVLLKKPTIFIFTSQQKSDYENIKAMASWLGKTPIYIDEEYDLDWRRELAVDEDRYVNYKDCFIKKPGSEDLNSWQIFANKLKTL